ncbi:MAG: hypothetical protein WD876_00035 [Candidatus Pacearchaeota archaeon]
MVTKQTLKMAIIAGAAFALKYVEQHPKATESEAMGHVTKNINKIIDGLDKEE